MVDAYFYPSAFFLQNFSKNKTSNEGGERSYTKCCYFNQSNFNLHHQILQGLTEAVGLKPQALLCWVRLPIHLKTRGYTELL